jgi:hypothetical protein
VPANTDQFVQLRQWFTEKVVPTLLVSLLTGALVLGGAAGRAILNNNARLDRHDDRTSVLLDRLDRLDREFHESREPGDRFTAADGNRVRESVRVVDQQCRRCAERIERVEATIEAFHRD